MNRRTMHDGGAALGQPVKELKLPGAFSFSLASVIASLDPMGGTDLISE